MKDQIQARNTEVLANPKLIERQGLDVAHREPFFEFCKNKELVNAVWDLLIGYILSLRGIYAVYWRDSYIPQMGQTSRSLCEVVRQGTALDYLSRYVCIAMKDCRRVSWLSEKHGWNLPLEDTQFLETCRCFVIRRPRRFRRRSRSLNIECVASSIPSYRVASIGYRRDESVRDVTGSFLTEVHSRTKYVREAIRASPSFTPDTFRRCRQTIAIAWNQNPRHNLRVGKFSRRSSSDCSMLVKPFRVDVPMPSKLASLSACVLNWATY